MKTISVFVPWSTLDHHAKAPGFAIRTITNNLMVTMVRAGVAADGISTSIHVRSMGLMFEMSGELGKSKVEMDWTGEGYKIHSDDALGG